MWLLPACQVSEPLLTTLAPFNALKSAPAAFSVAPEATVQPPAIDPPVHCAWPFSTAPLPVWVPAASVRFDEVKAPLKVDAVFTTTLPAPVNTVPALKVLLPPKAMLPVCASTVPLLTMFKAVESPISVTPVPRSCAARRCCSMCWPRPHRRSAWRCPAHPTSRCWPRWRH